MADPREERHFRNPWLKDIVPKRCKNDPQESLADLKPRLLSAISEELEEVSRGIDTSDQSVYTGLSGVALLHLHLANTIYSGSDPEKKTKTLRRALDILAPVLQKLKTRRSTFLCGAAGPLSLAAILHTLLDEPANSQPYIQQLQSLYTDNRAAFNELPSELLYGHSGYLYALLLVNTYTPGAIDSALINEICAHIIETGLAGCESNIKSPLMYTWHDRHYLGAAHGLAGIVTVLLQVTQCDTVSHYLDVLHQTVDYLLTLQHPTGNFPSSLESQAKDVLIHWCHGAPGFIHLLATAYRVFGDKKYLKAAEKCGEAIWERGLLVKGYGLCHGSAGNGYAFLQLYRITGDDYQLHRALKFAEWCITSRERECRTPDSPYSLFEGLAGKLYFLADVCNPGNGRFPALELPPT